jgi:aspartyl protease family protein
MAISSGTASVLRLAGGWLLAGAIGVAGIAWHEDIRTALGLRITAEDLRADVPEGRSEPRLREAADPVPATTRRGGGTVELRAGRSGHFETTAYINGRAVDVLIDTGATTVALSYEDARAAGIFLRDSDFKYRVQTANGIARAAAVTLDSVAIEDIVVRNVRASVAEPGNQRTTLLGMSFLSRLSRTEMSRGVLVLRE